MARTRTWLDRLHSMAIDDLRNQDWVLLPGTLCTEEVFSGFLDALGVPSARRKPVKLSLPAVEDYAAPLTSLAKGAVLCGFSLGAIVAAHNADRVKAARTVLFALNPYPDDPAKAGDREGLLRDVQANGGGAALSARLAEQNGPAPEKARKLILSMADKAAPDIEAHTSLALTRPGALDALGRCQAPVMALTGDRDDATPVALGKAAADAAPSGHFIALPGLGHYALVEDPKECARSFLALEERIA